MKLIFVVIFLLHNAVVFLNALTPVLRKNPLVSIFHLSYFRQGWGFFGPYPILSYSDANYRCISGDKYAEWKNVRESLEKSKQGLGKIIPSNNADYIVDALAEGVVDDVTEESKKLCLSGNCSFFENDIRKSYSYREINKLSMKFCDPKNTLAIQVKINIYNIPYFSQRNKQVAKKNITDSLLLPVYEI